MHQRNNDNTSREKCLKEDDNVVYIYINNKVDKLQHNDRLIKKWSNEEI